MKTSHITVSNAEFYEVLRADSVEGETNWTVNRHVQPGDRILLYICAPVSAIVAAGIASNMPELEEGPSSPWFGQYLVDMHDLRILAKPLTREMLLAQFPAWGYWKQPRNSVRVPENHLKGIDRLLSNQDS